MSDAADMDLGWEAVKGFAGKMLQAVLGFVGTVVFARVLGPTSFGGFYFLLSMAFLAERPIFGVCQAVRKRYSEEGANRPEIMGGILLAIGAFLAVAVAVLLPLNGLLETHTHVHLASLVFLAILASRALFSAFQRMIGAMGLLSKQTWNDTLRSVLTLPLQIVLVLGGLGGLGAAGMGYGLAGATLTTAGVGAYIVGHRPALPSRSTLWSLWEYAKYSTPGALVGKTYDRLDVLLLGVLVTTGTVGYYEVAYKLTVPATFLSTVVLSGLMPKISSLASKGEEFAPDITNAVAYVSVLAIPVFFGALALAKPLVVTFYGPEYARASAFLIGLALYQVIAAQSGVFQQTLMGLDRPDIQLRISSATLGFNVVVGVALVMSVGPIGVVVATVFAETARYLMSAYAVAGRVDGIDFLPRTLGEQALAGALMFGVVDTLHTYVAISNWFDLAVLVGAGAVAYGLTLLAVSSHLRLTIRSIYADAVSG